MTGLEPATSGVTGRHSNQLSYNRAATVPGREVGLVCDSRTGVKRISRPMHAKMWMQPNEDRVEADKERIGSAICTSGAHDPY